MNPSITIADSYQIDFVRNFQQLDIETSQFKIHKVIQNLRMINVNLFDLDW
jgi:ATP-dependent RNA circularization protein (DNA/RNA ligase family)